MDIKHFLKDHAYQSVPLNFEEAFELGVYAVAGCNGDALAQIQSIVALSALHNQGTYAWQWNQDAQSRHQHNLPANAAEQIAGICAAILERDIATSPLGFLHPKVPFAMDNCGMGGDLVVTANVSTLAALIAAAAGIPMCKHGSPANADKGRHGSSDFMSMLGINPFVPKEVMQECIEKEAYGYVEALDIRYKRIHLQTHAVAKLPHMNDIIGPLTSPLSPDVLTRRVVGINHLIPPRIVAEACLILNQRGFSKLKEGFFVRGFTDLARTSGVDEVSICMGGTQVSHLLDGEIRDFDLEAQDFGLSGPVPVELISPPTGLSKGDFSMQILKGEVGGAPLDMVLANAALLFVLAGKADSWTSGFRMAQEVHSSGATYRKVVAIQEALHVPCP